jgi:NAD+ kinase
MKVGVFGRQLQDQYIERFEVVVNTLLEKGVDLFVYRPFLDCLNDRLVSNHRLSVFNKGSDLSSFDLIISFGGDGTILELMTLLKDQKTPILGINTGRLGFIASINVQEIDQALMKIFNKEYRIELRSMLLLETDSKLFGQNNFALNELTVLKKDSSSMISISTYLDDEYMGNYWADGLIISTPTGSTAYSMSCGGPIVTPGSKTHVVTPIAPHNLNMRPIVIPDNRTIKLKIDGRSDEHLISLDSRNLPNNNDVELTIKKAPFFAYIIILEGESYNETLRNKLYWGIDKRSVI